MIMRRLMISRVFKFFSIVYELIYMCKCFDAAPFLLLQVTTETSGSAETSDAEGDGGNEGEIGNRWRSFIRPVMGIENHK